MPLTSLAILLLRGALSAGSVSVNRSGRRFLLKTQRHRGRPTASTERSDELSTVCQCVSTPLVTWGLVQSAAPSVEFPISFPLTA